jgi:hypothetical protein
MSESGREMAPLIAERGASHVADAAVEVDTAANQLRTSNGTIVQHPFHSHIIAIAFIPTVLISPLID